MCRRYLAVMAQMKERAEAYVRQILDSAVPEGEEEDVPEEVAARLRALGYID